MKMVARLVFMASLAMIVAAHQGHDHSHEPTKKREGPPRAVARLLTFNGKDLHVHGNVTFTEEKEGIHVHGHIVGMPAGEYGFTIHEFGDLTGGCDSTGGHFNPDNNDHGHPDDEIRHAGDLGNIEFNTEGLSHVDFVDKVIALSGSHNIIGRSLVLHAMADDYGKTEHPDSKVTGNAGDHVACGVIGIY